MFCAFPLVKHFSLATFHVRIYLHFLMWKYSLTAGIWFSKIFLVHCVGIAFRLENWGLRTFYVLFSSKLSNILPSHVFEVWANWLLMKMRESHLCELPVLIDWGTSVLDKQPITSALGFSHTGVTFFNVWCLNASLQIFLAFFWFPEPITL